MPACYIQIPSDAANTGKLVHHVSKTVNISGVDRTALDRVDVIGDPLTDVNARVLGTTPAGTEGGLVTRPILPASFAVSNFPATQPVSIASVPSHAVTNAGTFAVQAAQSGAWTVTANAGTGTFAVAAASLPLPAGAATAAKQPALGTAGTASTDVVSVQGIANGTALPVSLAIVPTHGVTGTFWQATQPVSGTVAVSNLPASQAVTGAFFQATQPISGTVAVSNFPASQAVTGAFFQATQPVSIAGTVAVSGPLTDAQLRASVVPTIEASCTWTLVATGATAAAATVTQAAAGVGVRNYCQGFTISWTGAAMTAVPLIQVKDGATVLYESYFGSVATTGVVTVEFTRALRGTANTAMTVSVSAGLASMVQKVSARGYTGT